MVYLLATELMTELMMELLLLLVWPEGLEKLLELELEEELALEGPREESWRKELTALLATEYLKDVELELEELEEELELSSSPKDT